MISADLWNMIVSNAPPVAVMLFLFYRLEKQLADCVAKQSALLDKLLDRLPDETSDTR